MRTKLPFFFFVILFSIGFHAQSLTVTSTTPSSVETGDLLSFTADYTTDASTYNLIIRFYESDGVVRYGTAQSIKGLSASTSGTESLSINAPLVVGDYVAKVFLEINGSPYTKTFAPDISFTVTAKVYSVKSSYLFGTDSDLEGWEVGTTGGGGSGPIAAVATGSLTFGKGTTNYGTTYIQQNDFKLDPTVHKYIHITYNSRGAWSANNLLEFDWIKSGTTRSSSAGATVAILNNPSGSETVTYNLGANIDWIDGNTVADAIGFRIYYKQSGSDTKSGDLIVDSIVFSNTAATPNVFTGAVDNDFTNAANWSSNIAPPATDNILIPADKGVDVVNLTVDPAGSLTIESGGSLKVSGTASGNVTYNRNVGFVSGDQKGWFLMGSPVISQDFNDTYINDNDIAVKGSNRGIATYNTSTDSWVYHQGATSGTFSAGTGYSVKKQSNSNAVSFTGTLNVDDLGVSVPLSMAGNRFNLLGNPYPAYVNSATFLTNQAGISDTQIMYVFNKNLGANGQYEAKNIAQNFILAPGQGFFVKANATGAGSFNFSEANQSHNATDTFQKSAGGNAEITLSITDGNINNYGKIFYLDNVTNGLDIGYDAELFNGQASEFGIYTHLVSDNRGKKYQIQSLPNAKLETTTIPVGVNAKAGKEITISATSLNLPAGINVYLEDRELGVLTNLNDGDYSITLEKDLKDVGRFFITSTSSVLSTENIAFSGVQIYTTDNSTLRVAGLNGANATVSLYNILGKKVMNTNISNSSENILLPRLAKGIYIVKLESKKGTLNKKIILD